MKQKNIDILKKFGEAAKELGNKPLSERYFKQEQKMLEKRERERKELSNSVKISYEKMHTPFNI
jgi:hypothetical protein